MRSKRITRVEFPAKTISPTQPPPTKRVAAYARVSTMKDAQENSFQSQQEYFTEYIQRHSGWVFAGMYADDGISGLSIRKRDDFNRMVADALDGKIDLILTKSLSRFARNTVDALTAIRSLKAAGVEEVFVQPTHFLCGVEYDKLRAEALSAASGFARLRVGRPLLASTEDLRAVAAMVADRFPAEAGRAVVLMGHGTTAGANLVYPAMQAVFDLAGRPDIRVGTVEGWPTLAEVCGQLAARPGVSRVKLAPLMLAAGDHVLNDMAGDGPDSWKNVLAAEGYQVECVLHGLAAEQAVRQMYADRLREELVD